MLTSDVLHCLYMIRCTVLMQCVSCLEIRITPTTQLCDRSEFAFQLQLDKYAFMMVPNKMKPLCSASTVFSDKLDVDIG